MLRKDLKQATRERLLEAAEASFIESNFKASTAAVARKAKVAHGTIFFHFRNRDDLVLAVVLKLVVKITVILYQAYQESKDLDEFLNLHIKTIRSEWPLFKALFTGFSDFTADTKQEIICLLSVVNYYLIESFNRWSDNGALRTMLWQGLLVYFSFLGDYMFGDDKISEKYIQSLMSFITTPKPPGLSGTPPPEKKLCMSCGMILGSPEDSPKGDTSKEYCRYCAGDDCMLKPFDEVLKTMTSFLQRTQGLNVTAAQQAAFAILAKNPAWREYVKKYY
jgi:AcrR family transcriptional regulator